MATLTVRNLDDELVRKLRIQAAEHGRSAEAEHRELLKAALVGEGGAPIGRRAARQQAAERLAKFRQRTSGRGSKSSAELLAESRANRLLLPGADPEELT